MPQEAAKAGSSYQGNVVVLDLVPRVPEASEREFVDCCVGWPFGPADSEHVGDRMTSDIFKVSLRDNGLHSLWKGIDSYEEYDRTQNEILLKDAIMFLHHGVELLMKEVLVKHSPFLIFEDLRDAAKKQKQADDASIGIFFLKRPPRTVTFEEAISRVVAFVRPTELTNDLQARLSELNRLRNQLEHYAIEADKEDVTRLLAELRNPLLELFDAQIGGIKRLQTPRIIHAWDRIQESARFYSQLEQEVFGVVKQFRGQKIPGRLLNVAEEEFCLPTFEDVQANVLIVDPGDAARYEVDVWAKAKDTEWVIEVKGGRRIDTAILDQLAFRGHILNSRVWLVAFFGVSERLREIAHTRGIFVTGANEWKELKEIVEASS